VEADDEIVVGGVSGQVGNGARLDTFQRPPARIDDLHPVVQALPQLPSQHPLTAGHIGHVLDGIAEALADELGQ
jgi:hypothetical protein